MRDILDSMSRMLTVNSVDLTLEDEGMVKCCAPWTKDYVVKKCTGYKCTKSTVYE